MKNNKFIFFVAIATLVIAVGCDKNKQDKKNENGFNKEIQTQTQLNSVTIKTNETDKVEIGKSIFEKYLSFEYDNYETADGKNIDILKNYKINKLDLYKELENGSFEIEVDYDLQAQKGFEQVIVTGNGSLEKDGWVVGKHLIIRIDKISEDEYKIAEIFTA